MRTSFDELVNKALSFGAEDPELVALLGETEQESVGTISSSDYLKWAQRSLNRRYGLRIPTNGTDSGAYRDALRRFNREYSGRDYADVDEETQNNLIFVNEAPGPYVAWVVQALNAAGFGPIPTTNAYTPAILEALKDFQSSRKPALKVDSFVGSKTELALIQASGLLPPGDVKRRPKPRPSRDDPTPEKQHRFIVVRGDTTDEVRSLALRSALAAFRAQARFEYLSSLPPGGRRKEWNRGHERQWFGPYGASRNAPFGKVKRRIDLIAKVFRGRRSYNDSQRSNRIDLLTIESFNCAFPGNHVCSQVDPDAHPVLRWEKGQTPEARLQIEAQSHRKDRAFFCCHERETLGLAFRAKTRLDRLRDQIDLGIADRPHKIALCPGWFIPPTGRRLRRMWERERNTTIAHEVAHLAGAMKLKVGLDPETGTRVLINAEVYRPIGLRTLAGIRPFLARINAENYAKYVMEFAKVVRPVRLGI